jgi:hypothetical protein
MKEVGHGRGVVQEMKVGQVGEGVAKVLPENSYLPSVQWALATGFILLQMVFS